MSWDKTKDELREQTIRQTNKRKKTAKWCRGKVGVEHVTETVVNHNYSPDRACGWRQLYRFRNGERQVWRWHYSCKHAVKCVNCGKYTETFLKPEQCPDFVPGPE
ncbi:MAG TPA: hypothetical protein VF885_24140 [Arthrobacter sp.]